MDQKTSDSSKRRYEKPRLRVIELAADEVLAVGCKTDSGGTNVGPPTCVTTTYCLQSGS